MLRPTKYLQHPPRTSARGLSSVGRALPLQGRCQEFESPRLHTEQLALTASGRRAHSAAAWKTVPSSYIICEQDEILPPAFQEAMSARSERSYRLSSSHSPFLSMPAVLASLITTDVGI